MAPPARRRTTLWTVALWLVLGAGAPALGQTTQPIDCLGGTDDLGEPCPDLQIPRAQASIDISRLLTIEATLLNSGAISAPPARVLAFGGGLEGDGSSAELAPDGFTQVSIQIQVPPEITGRIDFTVVVDPDFLIPEEDELNNTYPEPLLVDVPIVLITTETTTTSATTTETLTTQVPTRAQTLDGKPASETFPRVWVIVGIALLVVLGTLWFTRRLTLGRPRSSEMSLPPTESPAETPIGKPFVRSPRRTVSTGFASPEQPDVPLDMNTTLPVGTRTLFWLEVGEVVPGAIDVAPKDLPLKELPRAARLDVTLAALGRGPRMEIVGGQGELELRPAGEVSVTRQPERAQQLPPPPVLAERRLLFETRTPVEPGIYRMRCGIYHQQTLIQSRVVTATVTSTPEPSVEALRTEVDFSISASLSPSHIADLPVHRVSLMLNHSNNDTHDLLVLGEGGVRMDLPLDAQELQNLIRIARAGLRLASWASEDEWNLARPYRYETPSPERLRLDLASMAVRGAVLYAKILAVAAAYAGQEAVTQLQELLRPPSAIQVALGRSARRVFPAALIYDFLGLDTTLPLETFRLCETFLASLESGLPLETSVCFTGGCDTRGKRDVVCPSGFWGWRHELGLPVSELESDSRTTIDYEAAPAITIAVSTDEGLTIRPEHEQRLHAIWGGGAWIRAVSRTETLQAFKERAAHVVYLYCHGGVTPLEEPYVQVGPLNDPAITAAVLAGEGIRWDAVRPLVFINGCHTTALEPEKAFELVGPLVALHGAAGVIGTEITVFEPLARDFAESCLRRFLEGAPLGAAIRGARLDLLADGNPLGLAYIPFALPALRLRRV